MLSFPTWEGWFYWDVYWQKRKEENCRLVLNYAQWNKQNRHSIPHAVRITTPLIQPSWDQPGMTDKTIKKGRQLHFFLKIYSHTVPVLIQNQWSLNVKQKPEHQRATKQSSTANVLKLQAAENKLFHRDHVRFTDVCSHIPITEFKALLYVLTLTMQ